MYITLVVGSACIKKDYMWISHDDPNLLYQSILINKGYIPNVDYFSGYPGLGLWTQSIIIHFFGYLPVAEHILSAIFAIVLGFVFFKFKHSVPPFIIFSLLLFSYSQTFALNPTPNAGYLFDIFFIIGVCLTFRLLNTKNIFVAVLAGVCFALAFFSKQYGVFGPIFYLICVVLCSKLSMHYRKILVASVLIVVTFIFMYSYFGGFIIGTAYTESEAILDKSQQLNILFSNAMVISVPIVISLFLLLFNFSVDQSLQIGIKQAVKLILASLCSYAVMCLLLFAIFYGHDNIFAVFSEIFVYAPKRINRFLVPISFSSVAILKSVYGTLILILFFASTECNSSKLRNYILYAAFLLVCILLVRRANLSTSPFLLSAYAALLVFYKYKSSHCINQFFFFASIAFVPSLLILIPYPNYAYHIPILCCFILYYLSLSSNFAKTEYIFNRPQLYTVFACALLVFLFMCNLYYEVKSYQRYIFNDFTFISSDPLWLSAIEEARSVTEGRTHCTTYACRYLLLVTDTNLPVATILERPVH